MKANRMPPCDRTLGCQTRLLQKEAGAIARTLMAWLRHWHTGSWLPREAYQACLAHHAKSWEKTAQRRAGHLAPATAAQRPVHRLICRRGSS